MNFPYIELKGGNSRPVLKVEISSLDGNFVEYPYMLVDSGADITVINIELAELLGVDLKTCTRSEITGVGGAKLVAYKTRLCIKVKDNRVTSDVVFAELTEKGYGMLGQRGFFEHYLISFNGNKKKFSIDSPYSLDLSGNNMLHSTHTN